MEKGDIAKDDNKPIEGTVESKAEQDDTWDKTRELLIFQLKLFADAARDLLLSPVAIFCFILDLVDGNSKKDSYFEKLMAFGRRTDHHINLFKHRKSSKKGMMTVDDAATLIEKTLVNEVKTGEISEKSINAVKEAFNKRFGHGKKESNDK